MAREQAEWLKALKDGEEWAARELVADFSAPLGRYLLGMLKHQGEAEELVQDAFMRFFARVEHFRGETSLKGYLFKIATNLALNRLNSPAAKRETFPAELPTIAGEDPSPAEQAERSEESERVRACVRLLPERQRAVVIMRNWSGLSFAEIAIALGLAEGTVKAHYFFALQGLRKRLEGSGEPR